MNNAREVRQADRRVGTAALWGDATQREWALAVNNNVLPSSSCLFERIHLAAFTVKLNKRIEVLEPSDAYYSQVDILS